ncbi:alkaline phosphatase [Marinobacterium nitratireducens]|uniref:Alkaline phosphatase n=1 Tax=Marinobacterium nitratireducens TaxID=518897 RepID=A0A917Z634_9GAMM|nr:alkaline phosphatase [Marinobacterium nitratireducens]GGO76320.1 alkaline phosphatase [Marinobacterium nitratireducens]
MSIKRTEFNAPMHSEFVRSKVRVKRTKTLLLAAAFTATLPATLHAAEIKNVILMIGDGMGPQQVGLLETYAQHAPHSIYKGRETALSTFAREGVVGASLTNPTDAIVVDSACSATQLATGMHTGSEVIGIDAQGNHVETILEKAKRLGKATGIVSDTRLTHATPAAFAAHQPHRSLENDIAVDMINVGADVMLSGGISNFIPKSTNEKGDTYNQLVKLTDGAVALKSKRKDERNLLSDAQNAGYSLAFNRQQLDAQTGDKLLGLFSSSYMADGVEYRLTKDDPVRKQPTLAEMTEKALSILQKDNDGFFLMVEGGQIDLAGHQNDAGRMLNEMVKFDEAVQSVYDWAKDREDTLVIVTADHETGSFGFSYSSADLPKAQKRTGPAFKDQDYKPAFNFGSFEILDGLYDQKLSYEGLFKAFSKMDEKNQTPAALAALVNKNSVFTISEEQAKRVLTDKVNPYYDEEHSYLKKKNVPAIHDFDAFFPYNQRGNVLAREQATKQNVVWGTGTHTAVPVNVFAWGPAETILPISRIAHHSVLGQFMIDQIQ